MATLTGENINNTYQGLIKTDNNAAITSNLVRLTDGVGGDLKILVSDSTVSFDGNVNLTAATITGLSSADLSDVASLATVTYVNTQDGLLQADIDANATDIATLQTDFLTLDGEVTDLQNGVGNVISVAKLGSAGIVGAVTLEGGTNVTLTQTGQNIKIDATAGGGGVSSIEGLSGAIDLVGAQNIAISTNGIDTITITGYDDTPVTTNASAISALDGRVTTNEGDIATLQAATHVNSLNTLTGAVTLSAGTNITFATVGNDIEINATSGSTTINNNADNRIITGSNTANTLEAESLLTYDPVTATVYLDYSSGSGLVLDAGTIPTVNPSIGVRGFFTNLEFADDVITSNNIILRDQAKVVFDGDTANTFIAADLSTPENLNINADGYVDVYIADGFRVWEQNSAPAPVFVVSKSGDFARVAIGQAAATTNSELYVDGKVEAQYHLYDYNGTALEYQGELVNWGTTATTAGRLYYWTGTAWALADADVLAAASSLLAIAIANTSDKGMLVQGWVKAPSGLTNGQLYMSPTAGEYTTTQPSTSGQYVRVIGHGMNDLTFRFNPSNDFYEVE